MTLKIFLVFISKNKCKACNHSFACLLCWLPPSDHFILQAQNSPRLLSVNLQSACPRMMNDWRYSQRREQELKAQYFILCPLSSFQNGNAELMILRLEPLDCFLSLGCQEAFGSDVPPAFLFFSISVSYYSLFNSTLYSVYVPI